MGAAHDLAVRAAGVLPAEAAHQLTVCALAAGLGPRPGPEAAPSLACELAGMPLSNPIGLAAGFDKDARAPDALIAAGFGFVECGTVTPLPQTGNPRPRLFRLRQDRAVINRLGFNSLGLESFARRLERRTRSPGRGPIGANIGANRHSPDRAADYVTGLTRLWSLADYFTLNVSSPNTAGLRDLQGGGLLETLLGGVAGAVQTLTRVRPPARPIFLKVAPDLEAAQIETIVEAAVRHRLAGLVISNTTVERPADLVSRHRLQEGGLSGAPLMDLSTRRLAEFHAAAAGRLVLIGAGGVSSGADAYAKIRAGACAVQLYTALIYQGPSLILKIRRDLAAQLAADGLSLAEAVGAR